MIVTGSNWSGIDPGGNCMAYSDGAILLLATAADDADADGIVAEAANIVAVVAVVEVVAFVPFVAFVEVDTKDDVGETIIVVEEEAALVLLAAATANAVFGDHTALVVSSALFVPDCLISCGTL